MIVPNDSAAAALLLAALTSLSACTQEFDTAEKRRRMQTSPPQAAEIPEGKLGLVRSGKHSFSESELRWDVRAGVPLRVEWSLKGSRTGSVGGEDLLGGPIDADSPLCITYSQHEVQGEKVLEDVEVLFGRVTVGEMEPGDLAEPPLAGSTGLKFQVLVGRDTAGSLVGATTTGWVPGSVRRGPAPDGGLARMAASAAETDESSFPYSIGEPIWLAWCVESRGGSTGVEEQEGELVIVHEDPSGESSRTPLSEYEGRAWGLVVTFHAAE
jgi:hypothetical protein